LLRKKLVILSAAARNLRQAIQILNELSEYSHIDSSKEYLDLSKSLIEDYEKYIAQIDSLVPMHPFMHFGQK